MNYQDMRERLLARPRVKAAYDMQIELSKLGRLIQRARVGSNLRQQDLAALSGVAQGDISRLEIGAGEKGPTFETLVRLAHAQGMKLVVELVRKDSESIGVTPDALAADESLEVESAHSLRAAF